MSKPVTSGASRVGRRAAGWGHAYCIQRAPSVDLPTAWGRRAEAVRVVRDRAAQRDNVMFTTIGGGDWTIMAVVKRAVERSRLIAEGESRAQADIRPGHSTSCTEGGSSQSKAAEG